MDLTTYIIVIHWKTTDVKFWRPTVGLAQEHSQVAPQADHCKGGMNDTLRWVTPMVRENMHNFEKCQWVPLHCWCRSNVSEMFDCRVCCLSKTWSFHMLLGVRTLTMEWYHALQTCDDVWKKKWLESSTVLKGMWAPGLKLGILCFPNLAPTTLAHAKHGFSFFCLPRPMPGPGLRLLPHYAKLIAGGARGPKEARDYALESLLHFLAMV